MIQMIHDDAIEQGKKIDIIIDELGGVKKHLDLLPCDEHRKQIEANSKFRWQTYGIAMVLAFIVSIVVSVIKIKPPA